MMPDTRNHDGLRPQSSLALGLAVYPLDASVGEMDAASALLDDAMDDANQHDGDIDAWLRRRYGNRN